MLTRATAWLVDLQAQIRVVPATTLLLLTLGCAHAGPRVEPGASPRSRCTIAAEDWSWIEQALAAWRFSAREITGIGRVPGFEALFFDADCALTDADAFEGAGKVRWTATPHGGTVTLPDGGQIPSGVTSFVKADTAGATLVMATPSVWRAGGVSGGELGLETLMIAVFLHEGSHVAQLATYGRQVDTLARRHGLPESFNDDSMQQRFEGDAAFAASVARETDQFFQAAAASDPTTACRQAAEARGMMRARAARWFAGQDAYWSRAEDLWLTLEGAGQWAGYQWLIHPRGAGVQVAVALTNFARRSHWWSQNEGLAIFLALDRIAESGWKRHAFGDGARTVLEMLDGALEACSPDPAPPSSPYPVTPG